MVMPLAHGYRTMFPPSNFSPSEWSKDCRRSFSVEPQPHWITTYYGGQDIKLVPKKFAGNIIFTNGLRDPFSRDVIGAVRVTKASRRLRLAADNCSRDGKEECFQMVVGPQES
ncbi:hypothetical protein POM88_010728 [Heracleum sosnowskyi]|uniref:Uncharacterized protein n=1 Tax=Heracleum sosnowskyi TaxID=360622 RepID=A0AAD8IT74_9APIA|nr:hypothetical protein POM88_010728 [Heracleum sosnowskyi]